MIAGSWLAALLDDGNLVLWDREAEEIRHVVGLAAFVLKKTELSCMDDSILLRVILSLAYYMGDKCILMTEEIITKQI